MSWAKLYAACGSLDLEQIRTGTMMTLGEVDHITTSHSS